MESVARYIRDIAESRSEISIEGGNSLYPSRGGLDITRARDILGYAPKVSLLKGLNHYYDWVQEMNPPTDPGEDIMNKQDRDQW